ncbi:hypothetical protein A8C32_19050 [Flavivirga aquatica]|uniref:Iron dicitrate transport regulator FecR n=1 Tax=Flavivirga aquatica TaxID=1849968 RepID=A0A1E5T423_9FLAO|nr:FecR domain-containing protein [Flavivirga aquatica]OEK06130.1 hypothetical protein A8C32_19050 [Flavivirga aquatica]
MTNLSSISVLTNKLLEGKISDSEAKELDVLLLQKENAEFFKNAIKDDYLFKTVGEKFDTGEAIFNALKEIENSERKSWRFPKKFYKYAATAVLFLSISSAWFISKGNKEVAPTVVNTSEKNIELLLDNGYKQLIKGDENYSIKNDHNTTIGHLNNDKLSYLENSTHTVAYNTLKIPYGKKFQVILSDGTKVDLNSGTVFKYPVNFVEGQPRQVYLENGEAYFDVTHDKEHRFIVNTNNHNIEVLGTQFNISSYKEDSVIRTTLVEGSVRVFDSSKERKALLLIPNEQSSWDKNNKVISKNVVDPYFYTGWRTGELLFKSNSFAEIVKKLERNFDVSITGYNEKLGQERFTARFENETIEQIMRYFSEVYMFNYTVKRDKIIIVVN